MKIARREFVLSVPAAVVGIAVSPGFIFANAPVLSFHLDRPYLDSTGLGKVYRPPDGMRSGAPLAGFKDEELSRYYGLI